MPKMPPADTRVDEIARFAKLKGVDAAAAKFGTTARQVRIILEWRKLKSGGKSRGT